MKKSLHHLARSNSMSTLDISELHAMSKEERKIRTQLEADIERTLEEELIDGLRRLALNLHKLYMNRAPMEEQSRPHNRAIAPEVETNHHRAATEVKMTITDLRVEGGCMMQINKPKNKARAQALRLPTPPCRSSLYRASHGGSTGDSSVRVDWKKTLRSGTCSVVTTIVKKEAMRGRRLPGAPNQNGKENSCSKPLLLKWKY